MKHKVFLGYDEREKLAYDVARFSIQRRTDKTVQVIPLELKSLTHILARPIEKKDGKLWCPISQAHMATEFAISRFCVPFLTKGWALFADSDIVCLTDIKHLFALADEKYAVMVVKHNQHSGSDTKMDGQVQSYYSRKNWSSVMLFNCDHPSNRNLTKEMLNTLPGRDLHAFCWLKDDEIGELPLGWNYLVNVTNKNCDLKLLHYTEGGAWFKDWEEKPTDKIWKDELEAMKK
jgi:lipopolysaccharide biosynthesis glycosyltransferase